MRNKLLVACVLLGGCIDSVETGSPGSGSVGDSAGDAGAGSGAGSATETDFDRAMMQTASSYKTFTKINVGPYVSTLGAFDINVYVHGDNRQYRTIHPETTSTETMPIGTLIVREVLDADGKVAKLTMMAKGPAGYDPTLGDWWFGEATPDGVPMQVGRLTACHSCHIPRATEDYLFGVPKLLVGH